MCILKKEHIQFDRHCGRWAWQQLVSARSAELHPGKPTILKEMAVNSRGPTYKVVLLGELAVGKTALFRRLKDNTFDEFSTATAGIDSCTKVTKVDGETVTVGL